MYNTMYKFLFNCTCVGIKLLKPYGLSSYEVPGNADFTTGQFWPACPCVKNVILINNPIVKRKRRLLPIDLMSIDPPGHLPPSTLYLSSGNLIVEAARDMFNTSTCMYPSLSITGM